MTSLGYLQYSEINDSSNSTMTEIDKKKQARHNITIKKRLDTNPNSENVQNMLKLINNSNGYDNEDGNGLADFNPPPRAEISTKISGGQQEGMQVEQAQQQMQAQQMQAQQMQAQQMQGQGQQQMQGQPQMQGQGQMQGQPQMQGQGQMQGQPQAQQQGQMQMQGKPLNIDYEKPTAITTNATTSVEPNVKPRQYPMPMDSYEGFNSLPKTYASDYYKQYVPYFNQGGQSELSKNQLYEKLNSILAY
jgi:hypothetical protein